MNYHESNKMLVFKINKNVVEKETKGLGREDIGVPPSLESKKVDLNEAPTPSANGSKLNSRAVKSSVGLSGAADGISGGIPSHKKGGISIESDGSPPKIRSGDPDSGSDEGQNERQGLLLGQRGASEGKSSYAQGNQISKVSAREVNKSSGKTLVLNIISFK